MVKVKGFLVLATGRVFKGWHFGAKPTLSGSSGEVVFNTSMTGYQEILTDPSYQGQIVAMTPSHIGNTGINKQDAESHKIFLSGFVVPELSTIVSNWRSETSLDEYLKEGGVAGLTGIDVRALTRYLRLNGAVNGLISTDEANLDKVIEKAKKIPSLEGQDLVKKVTASKPYQWTETSGEWAQFAKPEKKRRVAVIDYGVKRNILRSLVDLNCDVTVFPATSSAAEILKSKPDGIMLSNGPGDPAVVDYGIQTIKSLVEAMPNEKFALFGICLGHQLLGLALGGETYKLKFGHHGSNHPIKEIGGKRVDITSQNHGFALAAEQKDNGEWEMTGNKEVKITHINLNDNAIEGIKHKKLPIFSVQYHPEASAGPHDARHLFERFMKYMEKAKN